MTNKSDENPWPLPKFHFLVNWGSIKNISFSEVTGLDIEPEISSSDHENSLRPDFYLPGIIKNSVVTLRRGIFENSDDFWEWYRHIKMNTIERQDVVIRLLDELGNVSMSWTLTNAWPSRISSTSLKEDGNAVAIESIEIAHEGVIVESV